MTLYFCHILNNSKMPKLETENEPRLFGCHGDTNAKKNLFNEKIQQHQNKMVVNPFSGSYDQKTAPTKLSRDDPNYGRPVVGSKSEKRGLKAAAHINREVALLCDMIYEEGTRNEDGRAVILFKDLFQIYTRISNKLVGTLLRGRKHGFLDFEGETLFQGRDDNVPVFLLKPIKEIRMELASDQEFEVGVCHKTKAN